MNKVKFAGKNVRIIFAECVKTCVKTVRNKSTYLVLAISASIRIKKIALVFAIYISLCITHLAIE